MPPKGMSETEELIVTLARHDINVFAEYVLQDEETGETIMQAPHHVAWHELINRNDRVVIWAHIEAGKAVPLDTAIPTPSGWTTMGRLTVGDTVFGSDGKPCTVKWCSPIQHDREVYEIEFDDGVIVKADAEHQWAAWTIDDAVAGRPLRVVTTKEMSQRVLREGGAGHQYKWRIPICGSVQYPERELPIHPYVLGAWLGDGDSQSSMLVFHKDDIEVFERCNKLEPGDSIPTPQKAKNPDVLRAALGGQRDCKRPHGTGIRGRLASLGLIKNKHIPEQYLIASEHQRRELLAGLLDTDGTISNGQTGNSSRIEYCSTNKDLAYGVLEIARSLGFKVTVKESDAKLYGVTKSRRYRVCFTARQPVFHLTRKLAKQKLETSKSRASYRCIVRIEKVKTESVRCITVDSPDSTYLMDRSYTVTHNTQQINVAELLFRIGKNPSLRCAIISNTSNQSEKMINLLSNYIEKSTRLHNVFPHLKPSKPWSHNAITVERKTSAKDPTIQSCGVHGNITGSRLDLIVLDDILDYENTRTKYQRDETWNWYASAVAGRLTQNARVICVGTAYHPDDLLHRLVNQRGFAGVRFPVLTDDGQPHWPERWPADRIDKKRIELGPLEFARQMLCLARDEASSLCKREWIDLCLERGNGKEMCYALSYLPQGYFTYTGVDLAVQRHAKSDKTVFFTIAVHPDGAREILNITSGRYGVDEIVDEIVLMHKRYHSKIMVENNAAQDFIRQLAMQHRIPVEGFTTGRNKANPEFGIESMFAELANGQWIIPNRGGVCDTEIETWIADMMYYSPDSHTGDHLMASWFSREAYRRTTTTGVRPKPQTGKLNLFSR